jgi:hypothetical protein
MADFLLGLQHCTLQSSFPGSVRDGGFFLRIVMGDPKRTQGRMFFRAVPALEEDHSVMSPFTKDDRVEPKLFNFGAKFTEFQSKGLIFVRFWHTVSPLSTKGE